MTAKQFQKKINNIQKEIKLSEGTKYVLEVDEDTPLYIISSEEFLFLLKYKQSRQLINQIFFDENIA
jgi:hypothetical protein